MRSDAGRSVRPGRAIFTITWDLDSLDPDHWRPSAAFRRCRRWVAATRRRCWTAWLLIALFVVFVFPGTVVAMASAQTGTGASAAPNSALSWMDIKDSSGVELSSYLFATNNGGVWNPGNTVIALVIQLLFAVWLVAVTTGVWLPTDTLDFGWLSFVSSPLEGVAHSLSEQLATPMMLMTAVTIGAFFVGWFIVRGYHAKAAVQILTMLAVAMLGPIFLAEPLAEALSPDGLLAQGRDLGISVAAGLNGDSNPDPDKLVATMQAGMADNFARRPLQVWNFGHVVDDRASCRAVWSAGVAAGDEDRVKNGMKTCGDSAAYAAADNPSVGQIGAGLLLLLSAIILLLFSAYLAIKVIWAALDAIYYGFMTIFGFAAGGFVFGPTQTFTVRCVVHGFMSAARMAIFIIFLGVYQLFLANLFQQAGGQVMSVFVIGAIVMIVAVLQLRRLSASLDKGNDWIANRFALAIQNGGATAGSSAGSGATALGMGMGNAGASNSMAALATLAAFSTVSNSPLTEWFMGKTRQPLSPYSGLKKAAELEQWESWSTVGKEWANTYYDRRQLVQSGANALDNPEHFSVNSGRIAGHRDRESVIGVGGVNTARGAAAVIEGAMEDGGGTVGTSMGALVGNGFTDDDVMYDAWRARAYVERNTEDEPLAFRPVMAADAALRNFQDNRTAAALAEVENSVLRFRRAHPGGVRFDDPQIEALGHRYLANPNRAHYDELRVASENTNAVATLNFGGPDVDLSGRAAQRLMTWIGNEHALNAVTALDGIMDLPRGGLNSPAADRRVAALREALNAASSDDIWAVGMNRAPWTAAPPRLSSL